MTFAILKFKIIIDKEPPPQKKVKTATTINNQASLG